MDRERSQVDISTAVVDIRQRIASLNKRLAFWIWKHLAGGTTPFYRSGNLHTFTEPTGPALRRWLWNRAVSYLLKTGDLTFTPTLREKF